MQKMRSFIIILLLMTVFSSETVFASKNGTIKGLVTDAQTGAPLPGANVFLNGTGFGSSTDVDGYFSITNIPPGSYVLRTVYIGYKPLDIPVKIKSGMVITKHIKLLPQALEGEEIVVTSQASGQKAAINQQLSAKAIVNVVSSEQIQEHPDATAAEAISRIPGISIIRSNGEGNQVVIRGLSPKYNAISIDGVRIASSNPNDRSTDLSLISSSMLQEIEVSKTITADQDADALGGIVNFKMKEAKERFAFHLLAQGGYTGLSNAYNKYNNYKFVPSIEGRFFNNKLGIFAQASLERRNLTSNEFNAFYSNATNDEVHYVTQSIAIHNIPRDRKRLDGALVLDYKLPNGKISLSNFFGSSTTKITDRYETININSNQHLYTLSYLNHQMNMIYNTFNFDKQFSFLHAYLKLAHNFSETKSPADWAVTFYQSPANISQFQNEANLDPHVVADSVLSNPNKTKLNTVSTDNNYAMERSYMGSMDFEIPLNISKNITSVIKFGGKYRHKKRSYTSEVYGTNASLVSPSARGATYLIVKHFGIKTHDYTSIPLSFFVDTTYNYGRLLNGEFEMHNPINFALAKELIEFCQDNVEKFAKNGAKEAYARNNYLSVTHNYAGTEVLSAGYLMATINIGPKLTLIPGLRYQNLRTTYSGTRGQQTALSYYQYDHSTDTTVTVNHPYWLPDIHLKYKVFPWFNVRLSYSTTLSYPDYRAIIPRIDVTTGAALAWNNYKLKPLHSKNYDIYLTFSNNTIGLLTIGGFLKQIDNLIYPWVFYKAGLEAKPYYLTNKNPAEHLTYRISTYINNPFTVNDYGLEFDWQTHFWYLPNPLKGLVLDLNYTHIFSRAQYPYVIAGATSLTNIDTSFTDRLINQPDHILNITVGYDYKGFSIRLAMLYQDNVFKVVNQWPQLRSNTAAYKRLDITVKQKLPWLGFELFGNVTNLNNARDLNVLQKYPNIPKSIEEYGMTAELGLRWHL